jgi:hypothetical protein
MSAEKKKIEMNPTILGGGQARVDLCSKSYRGGVLGCMLK